MISKLTQLGSLAVMIVFGIGSFGGATSSLNNLGDLNVDVAFHIAQPYFIEQHLQYGKEIVFTYGPWGILLTDFTGSVYHNKVLLFRITLAVSIFFAFRHSVQLTANFISRATVWVGVLALAILWLTGQRESYYLFPALFVAYKRLEANLTNSNLLSNNASGLLWSTLSLLAGWVSLAKFNIFMVSASAFLIVLLADLMSKRRPFLPTIYIVTLLIAWFDAGQSLMNFPLWIVRCLNLSGGYTDAMSLGFFVPYNLRLVAVYYSAVALIMVIALSVVIENRWNPTVLLTLFLTVFICGISVKHGMGGNQIEQSLSVLVLALWLIGQIVQIHPLNHEYGRTIWTKIGVCAVPVSFTLLIFVALNSNVPIFQLSQVMSGMRTNVINLWLELKGISSDKWQETLVKANSFTKLTRSPSEKTIDVYPQQAGIVIGRQGFDYRPRPAFLSLNAHTAELARLNVIYLLDDKSPDLLLFQILPEHLRVNNRYPALADGPSWPLIISNYDLLDTSMDFLVLSKQNSPSEYQQKLLFEKEVSWGELVDMPVVSSGLIWSEIEIKRSLWGKLLHILYKSPHVLISSRTKDDHDHQYQLVPALAEAGFLLSPFVNDTLSFAQLQQRQIPINSLVKNFNLTSPEAPYGFWADNVKLRLYEISLPALKSSSLPAHAKHLLELRMLAGNVVTCLFPPKLDSFNGLAENVLAMHAPCKTEIPVPTEKQSLTIRFGLQENSYTGTTKTDGVSVEIVAVSSDGSEYKRWSRILNPQYNIEDRSVQQMTVNWQKGTVAKIYLNILPGINDDPAYDHSFVQDIVFE